MVSIRHPLLVRRETGVRAWARKQAGLARAGLSGEFESVQLLGDINHLPADVVLTIARHVAIGWQGCTLGSRVHHWGTCHRCVRIRCMFCDVKFYTSGRDPRSCLCRVRESIRLKRKRECNAIMFGRGPPRAALHAAFPSIYGDD